MASGVAQAVLGAIIFFGTIQGAESAFPFNGEKTAWHGFDRYDFVMDEATLSIAPMKAAEDEQNGADQNGPRMIEVGSGEAIMNKHLENAYRLSGLMRKEPGPVGFTPGPRWIVTPVPRDLHPNNEN